MFDIIDRICAICSSDISFPVALFIIPAIAFGSCRGADGASEQCAIAPNCAPNCANLRQLRGSGAPSPSSSPSRLHHVGVHLPHHLRRVRQSMFAMSGMPPAPLGPAPRRRRRRRRPCRDAAHLLRHPRRSSSSAGPCSSSSPERYGWHVRECAEIARRIARQNCATNCAAASRTIPFIIDGSNSPSCGAIALSCASSMFSSISAAAPSAPA